MTINLEARLVFRGDSAIRAFDRLESRMKKLDRVLESTDRTTDALDRSMGAAAGATRTVSRALDDVGSSARGADRYVDRLNRNLRETERRGRNINGWLGGKLRGLGGSIVSGGFNMIGNFARSAINTAMVTGTAALGGAAYLSGRGLGLAAEQEQAHIAFSTMLGSDAAADAFLDDLKEFAKVTPFDVGGLRDSSRQILAYGFAAEEVLPMMEALGNATSGLGLGQEGIDRISRALGQMRAKGRVTAEEMLQLTEAAIPAWEILAEDIGVTTGDVMDLTSRGLIPANRAIQSIVDGMNRRFPNMMERQSRSLSGLWAKMKETFDYDILLRWGQGIANAIKPRLESLSRWLDDNEETLKRWGDVLETTATQAADWMATKLENAFDYISDRYINNPEFTELDFTGKMSFVFDDISAGFTAWLDGGGRAQLSKISESIGEILGDGLKTFTPHLTEIALDMGGEFARGVLDGLTGGLASKTIDKFHEVDTFVSGIPNRAVKAVDNLTGGGYMDFADSIAGRIEGTETESQIMSGLAKLRGNIFGNSHAGGISNVPYNGYPARLHKGERVLTAEENREYKNGGNGDINVNIQRLEVREEADIKRIALELARGIKQAHAHGA